MEHKHKQAKTRHTNLEEDNHFFEEVTNFEETTNLEETIFEPTGGFQKGFQQQYKKPNKMPDPIEIDVDGDQVAELRVTFSKVDKKHIKAKILYMPNQQSEELVFEYLNEFSIAHQDPSDGKTPYKFHFFVHDYSKVFYATEKQWHTPTKEEIEAKKLWEKTKPGTDHLKSKTYPKLALKNFLSIQFQEKDGLYSYKMAHHTHQGVQNSKTLHLFSHEFFKFKAGNKGNKGQVQRGIVRDETAKRDANKQKKDARVSSYTIPIEVGKIGKPGTKGDHNKYQHTLTIQKSPKDNGLAAISLSGWSGTRLVPIPGKFAEVKRAVVTEKANHLELLFKGKKYNTILRIYQQYLMLNEKNSVGSKDEIYALNVYADPLPKNHWDVLGGSGGYFGHRLVSYKIQHIGGERLAYHNANDNKIDKEEFHQRATEDARNRIEDQPHSINSTEEFFNIRLNETRNFGNSLKGKTFLDAANKKISGEVLFMDYLDLVIAVHKLSGIIRAYGDQLDKDKLPSLELALLQDAVVKTNRFLHDVTGILKKRFFYEILNAGGISIDHKKTKNNVTRLPKISRLPESILKGDWEQVKLSMDFFHEMFSNLAIEDRAKEIKKHYEEQAKNDAKSKGTTTAEELVKYEREEAQAIKNVKGSFNLDRRYKKLLELGVPENDIHRVKALFYPEHLNVGEKKAGNTSIDLPLYYYKKEGYWHVVSLINQTPGSFFTAPPQKVKAGEKHPPANMFGELDDNSHLPAGILYYEIPGGDSKKVTIKSEKDWWEYAGYAALALFAIGLGAVTLGAGSLVTGSLFFAAGAVGATGAAFTIHEELSQGRATTKSLTVNILDIAGALIGGVRLVCGAFSAITKARSASQKGIGLLSALNARTRYVMLESLDLVVDFTMVAIGTIDGWTQIANVMDGPGTLAQKTKDVALMIPLLALQGGIFFGTVKGRVNAIKGAARGQILSALKGKTGKGDSTPPLKPSNEINAKDTPELYKLKNNSNALFSDEALEQVLGLLRHPRDFEDVAHVINKADVPQMKALSAQFSEQDVLYLLYYFKGDMHRVHKHLAKNKRLFGGADDKVYKSVYAHEQSRITGQKTKAELKNKTQDAKNKYKQQLEQIIETKQAKRQQAKEWTQAKEDLGKLKKSQQEAQAEAGKTQQKIDSTSEQLASHRVEEAQYKEFATSNKLTGASSKEIKAWKGQQEAKFEVDSQKLTSLEKELGKQQADLQKVDNEFYEQISRETKKFYKDLDRESEKLLREAKLKSDNGADLNIKAAQDAKIKEFDAKQKAKVEAHQQSRQPLQQKVDALQKQKNEQALKVKNNADAKAHFDQAIEVMQKGIVLRQKLTNLKQQHQALSKKIQEVEKQIKLKQTQMLQAGGKDTTLERQLEELRADKGKKQHALASKDVEIANTQKQLADLAHLESKYDLNIKERINNKRMTDKKIGEMLDQRVAPRDIKQLEKFIEKQQKRLNKTKEEVKTAGAEVKLKEKQLEEVTKAQAPLLAEKAKIKEKLKLKNLAFESSQTQGKKLNQRKKKGSKKKKNTGTVTAKLPHTQVLKEKYLQDLKDIDALLAPHNQKMIAAETALKQAKAKHTRAEAQQGQEEAKLDVYKEFKALQEKLQAGEQSLKSQQQARNAANKKLHQVVAQQKALAVKIQDHYQAGQTRYQQRIDEYTVYKDAYKKQYEQAKANQRQHQRTLDDAAHNVKIIREEAALKRQLADKETAQLKEMVNVFNVVRQSAKNLRNTFVKGKGKGANFPVFKAWWKICKILVKLSRPKTSVKEQAGMAAHLISQAQSFSDFLSQYMQDKSSETLPSSPEALWKALFETLEDPAYFAYYATNDKNRLMTALKNMYDHNKEMVNLRVAIKLKEQALANLKDIALPDMLSLDEQELLQKKEALQTKKLNQAEIDALLLYLKKLEKKIADEKKKK